MVNECGTLQTDTVESCHHYQEEAREDHGHILKNSLPSDLVKPCCKRTGTGVLCKLISFPTWSPPSILLPHVSSSTGGQSLVLEAKFKTLPRPQSYSEIAALRSRCRQGVSKNSVPETWQGPCSADVLITFFLVSITRLTLNSWPSSSICLLDAGIPGKRHHS